MANRDTHAGEPLGSVLEVCRGPRASEQASPRGVRSRHIEHTSMEDNEAHGSCSRSKPGTLSFQTGPSVVCILSERRDRPQPSKFGLTLSAARLLNMKGSTERDCISSGDAARLIMRRVSDLNIASNIPLPAPALMLHEIPRSEQQEEYVARSRQDVHNIIFHDDPRLLVIVGPCSIHDVNAGLDYATRLRSLMDRVRDRIYLVMRCYFEKPRTTVGWKGLIMDPHLDGSDEITEGLRIARRFLRDVTELGIPTATELLDPITPQYIADLICWSAVGARTTESQTHRQMASGPFHAAWIQELHKRCYRTGSERDQGGKPTADVLWYQRGWSCFGCFDNREPQLPPDSSWWRIGPQLRCWSCRRSGTTTGTCRSCQSIGHRLQPWEQRERSRAPTPRCSGIL